MNQSHTAKAIIALLAVAIVLTCATTTLAIQPLAAENDVSANMTPAKVDWAKIYGGSADDRAFYMLPIDNGFLVVGSSRSIINGTIVGWAIKLDSDGNMLWNQSYLYATGVGTELRCAINLTDGYLLVGNVFQSTGDIDGYIAKTGFDGNVVWQTFVGGSGIDKFFGGVASGGGFYVYGLTYSYGDGTAAGWIVKLAGDGTVAWNHIYGEGEETTLRSAVAADDGCVAAGYQDPYGAGNYVFCLYKVASDGKVKWNQTYGSSQSQKAYSMAGTIDGGYVLAGDVQSLQASADALAIKVDNTGQMLWRQQFGGPHADTPYYATNSKDGGILLTGFTFSYGAGYRDFWLTKLTSNGEVAFSCTYGDDEYEEAYGVVDIGGNQYVMAGWTDPANRSDLTGKATYDWYVVKLSVAPATNSIFDSPFLVPSLVIAAAFAATIVLLLKLAKNRKTV